MSWCEMYHVDYDATDAPYTQFHITYDGNGDKPLPTVKILGTGGTIASKGDSAHQTAGYKVDLTIEELVKSIPDLSGTCSLQYEQILNLDSKEIGTAELKVIYDKVQGDLPHYDGIVITHGTDTMEETAFFLQFTVNTTKPIVMCGSMRPSTAISSDGPMNLYQAIVIAANRASHGRGILVAFNDRIISGYFLKKSNANSLDTFNAIGQGYLGNFVNNQLYYYFPPSKPMGVSYLELPLDFGLPEVPILFAHQGFNNDILDVVVALPQLRTAGLVIATMGAGSVSDATSRRVVALSTTHNIPVIYSKRSMDGMVPIGSLPRFDDLASDNIIAAGTINPQKSRILLQLCLANHLDIAGIKRYFEKVYGGSS